MEVISKKAKEFMEALPQTGEVAVAISHAATRHAVEIAEQEMINKASEAFCRSQCEDLKDWKDCLKNNPCWDLETFVENLKK